MSSQESAEQQAHPVDDVDPSDTAARRAAEIELRRTGKRYLNQWSPELDEALEAYVAAFCGTRRIFDATGRKSLADVADHGMLGEIMRSTPVFIYDCEELQAMCKTAFVDSTGKMYFNALFFRRCAEEQSRGVPSLYFLFCHELEHLRRLHTTKRFSLFDQEVTAHATDICINTSIAAFWVMTDLKKKNTSMAGVTFDSAAFLSALDKFYGSIAGTVMETGLAMNREAFDRWFGKSEEEIAAELSKTMRPTPSKDGTASLKELLEAAAQDMDAVANDPMLSASAQAEARNLAKKLRDIAKSGGKATHADVKDAAEKLKQAIEGDMAGGDWDDIASAVTKRDSASTNDPQSALDSSTPQSGNQAKPSGQAGPSGAPGQGGAQQGASPGQGAGGSAPAGSQGGNQPGTSGSGASGQTGPSGAPGQGGAQQGASPGQGAGSSTPSGNQGGNQPGTSGSGASGQSGPGGTKTGNEILDLLNASTRLALAASSLERGLKPSNGASGSRFPIPAPNVYHEHVQSAEDVAAALAAAGAQNAQAKLGYDDLDKLHSHEETAKTAIVAAINKADEDMKRVSPSVYPGAHMVDYALAQLRDFYKPVLSVRAEMKHIVEEAGRGGRYEWMEPWDIYHASHADMGLSDPRDIPYQGSYVPGKLQRPIIVALIDSSGSVDDAMLKRFISEAVALPSSCNGEFTPEVVVLVADTIIRGEPTVIDEDNVHEILSSGLTYGGRGGTSLQASIENCFELFSRDPDAKIPESLERFAGRDVSAVFYFTDSFDTPPDFSVLQARADKCGFKFFPTMLFLVPKECMNHVFAKAVAPFAETIFFDVAQEFGGVGEIDLDRIDERLAVSRDAMTGQRRLAA